METSDTPADCSDDLVDHSQEVRLVAEAYAGLLQNAAPLDENAAVCVDKNIGDRVVLEQRLDRPEPQHLVRRVDGQLIELTRVERDAGGPDKLANDRTNLVQYLVARSRLQNSEIEPVDQVSVQFHLEAEKRIVGDVVAQVVRHFDKGRRRRRFHPDVHRPFRESAEHMRSPRQTRFTPALASRILRATARIH
jgi:hypothetical protein